MTPTVDCPHTTPAARMCSGCVAPETELTRISWCEGEVSGKVIRDSEGDPGVINGTNNFLAVEDLELSCGCNLSAAEEQAVTDQLCQGYAEDDGLADVYEDDARREAGW